MGKSILIRHKSTAWLLAACAAATTMAWFAFDRSREYHKETREVSLSDVTMEELKPSKELGASVHRRLDLQSLLTTESPDAIRAIELSREQWDQFLDKHGRSAEALAVAATVLGDESLFAELARNYPEDPDALLALIEFDRSQEIRNQDERIDTLRRVDPENAAGSIYAAIASLESGDEALAFLDLIDVVGHSRLDFGFRDRADLLSEAYADAGWDRESANLLGYSLTPLPQLNSIHKFSKEVASAIDRAHEEGRHDYARSLAEAGLAAATLLEETASKHLVIELTAGNMERIIYEKMGQFDLVRKGENLVFERLEELDRLREIARSAPDFADWEDPEIFRYFEIARERGERQAIEWARERE